MVGGISGAVVSNMTGIPFDKFRVLVAQDVSSSMGLGAHLKETLGTASSAFTGAVARVSMKGMATVLNLYVPAEFRESSPFACAFAVGFGFSPILNVPRMLQLQKIAGDSYPKTFVNLFTSLGGLQRYGANTIMFAPGEGLRMMMCFGTKDWIMPKIGGKEDPRSVNIPMHTLKMACIAGPAVSMVETTAALVTETVSTIHAKNSAVEGAEKKPFGQLLKETVTPKYTARCWVSLCLKNIMANTPLFWVMFMSDFYAKKHTLNNL